MAAFELQTEQREKFHQYLKVDSLDDLVFERKKPNDDEQPSPAKTKEEPTIRFTQLYEFKRILGVGGFGFVLHCVCKET